MIRRPLSTLLALLAALTLVMAACGNDDSTSAGPEPTDPPTTVDDDETDDDHDDDGHGHDAGSEDGAVEVSEPALRLLVTDAASGRVLVLDLATEDQLATLDLAGPARLYAEPHGRYVFAAQRDHDRVDWIDGGSWTSPHGDHDHHWAGDPGVTDWGAAAAEPTHVVLHDDLLTLFNDGDGSVVVVDTHHLGDADAVVGTWETGVAHHGVAIALEDHGALVVSITGDDPDDTLPIGVAVLDLDTGEEIDRFENCPGLHGEAATDDVVAFGCRDGVLLVEPHGDHWHSHKVERPAGVDGETRTGTLRAGHGLDHMIGNLGSDALVRIDLGTETATMIDLPGTAAAWALDAASDTVLVLTVDGGLHQIDATSGEVVASIELTDAIELPEGHGGPPRPSILVAGTRAYVTDPADEQVIEVAIGAELRSARTFTVGFAPLSVAVSGGRSH